MARNMLFRLLAFYLIWLPAGAYFALDALNDQRPVSERRYPVWPLRLLQIQMTLVYLSTLGEKLRGTDWFDGTALYYVSRLDDLFGRFPVAFGSAGLSDVSESRLVVGHAGRISDSLPALEPAHTAARISTRRAVSSRDRLLDESQFISLDNAHRLVEFCRLETRDRRGT